MTDRVTAVASATALALTLAAFGPLSTSKDASQSLPAAGPSASHHGADTLAAPGAVREAPRARAFLAQHVAHVDVRVESLSEERFELAQIVLDQFQSALNDARERRFRRVERVASERIAKGLGVRSLGAVRPGVEVQLPARQAASLGARAVVREGQLLMIDVLEGEDPELDAIVLEQELLLEARLSAVAEVLS